MALKELTLASLSDAEAFVRRTRNARWDNYDIVTFVPNHRGYANKNGVFDRATNRWGFEYRYPVKEDGTWSPKVFVHGSR